MVSATPSGRRLNNSAPISASRPEMRRTTVEVRRPRALAAVRKLPTPAQLRKTRRSSQSGWPDGRPSRSIFATPRCEELVTENRPVRSGEHKSELQANLHLVCRLLHEK